jgi:HSP20 family protein
MQAIRTSSQRLPQVFRVIPSRSIHLTRNKMSLFPRFTQEFSPLFRMLDEYDRATRQFASNWPNELRTFQPKFDVRELKDSYELHGELPGIEQKDISIEWTDGNTLSISGRTERSFESGTRPGTVEAIEDAPKASGAIQSGSSNEHYRKPSVADEGADETSTTKQDSTALTQTNTGEVAKSESQQPEAKYWISERSVGEFHRSFSFPTRVDHDGVKASLKNGILSIIVPKAQAPKARKIQIE